MLSIMLVASVDVGISPVIPWALLPSFFIRRVGTIFWSFPKECHHLHKQQLHCQCLHTVTDSSQYFIPMLWNHTAGSWTDASLKPDLKKQHEIICCITRFHDLINTWLVSRESILIFIFETIFFKILITTCQW